MRDIVQQILSDPAFMEGIAWNKRYFQTNEIIFRGGEPSKCLFFIEEGVLRVTVQVELENSRNMQPGICDMKAGEIFGETCFLESGMRNASVTAVTDGYAVEIDATKLNAYLNENPVKVIFSSKVSYSLSLKDCSMITVGLSLFWHGDLRRTIF